MQDLGKKVIYQIYPKSFYDSNGDGIGDLRGIIEKLDYIEKLNVDMIWFNPFFVSPQNDNGYDISDYYQIDPLFGTMEDFKELQSKLEKLGIDVMLDMVLNHCSTEHEWFKKALAGDKEHQKYFYLRPAKEDGSLPTNWVSKFGGPSWERFGNTELYYLHLYDKTQADLDWHNQKTRDELVNVVDFWCKKGVRGFRFDVINVIGKARELVDSNGENERALYTDTPVVHDYLKELNQKSFGKYPDSITVGEMSSTSVENCIKYSNPKEHELSMVFTFHHLKVDYLDGKKWTKTPFDFMKLKQILTEWQLQMATNGGWSSVFWNNHDQPFALRRFGDPVNHREKSAEMLATAIHLLRGTPCIYQGEEIGMIDPEYDGIEDYVDVEAINAYGELLAQGYDEAQAFDVVKSKARDNSRVPMHWTRGKNAGFSHGTPWLRPTDQERINVEDELAHGEIFAYYQKLIALRKNDDVIACGGFLPLLEDDEKVFAYVRTLEASGKANARKILVLNNFFGKKYEVRIPDEFCGKCRVVISNYERDFCYLGEVLSLEPYEALAVEI